MFYTSKVNLTIDFAGNEEIPSGFTIDETKRTIVAKVTSTIQDHLRRPVKVDAIEVKEIHLRV